MVVEHFTDAAEFLERATTFLTGDVPRNQLLLSVAEQAADQPDIYPQYHGWVVVHGRTVTAAAGCTPPHRFIVAEADTPEALAGLVPPMAASGVDAPGVIGNRPWVDLFVDMWKGETGVGHRVEMGQGIFSLERVAPLDLAPGAVRQATPAEHDLAIRWHVQFLEESAPSDDPVASGSRPT